MLCLLPLWLRKYCESLPSLLNARRPGSPPGASSFTTWAPIHARYCVAVGPASHWVKSSTRDRVEYWHGHRPPRVTSS